MESSQVQKVVLPNCKNCGHVLEGAFCSYCGQRASVKRISMPYLLSEATNSLLQLNRGLFFTIKELFVRPGHSLRAFLEGKRVGYYKPVSFLLLTTTVYIVSTYLSGRHTFFYEFIVGFESGANPGPSVAETPFAKWMSKYQVYVPLLLLPIFSLSNYLTFIKSGYNYLEHVVLNFYITGQQMILYLLLGFVFYKENMFMLFPIVIVVLYNFWVLNQLFDKKGFMRKNMQIILSYILSYVLIIAFVGIIFGLYQSLTLTK